MKTYKIGGFVIESVIVEPCYRVVQFMKNQKITCDCSKCLIDNKGMSSDEIKQRMNLVYS